MSPCPVCAEPAETEAVRAGVTSLHCTRCGRFALGVPARRMLVGARLNPEDRLWLSRRVRAEHDAARVAVVLFASRLYGWLRERAALRQPAGTDAAVLLPGAEHGQHLRQRQAQVVAQAARQLDRATALRWRVNETVTEARDARYEARRVRAEAPGPVLAARIAAGSPEAIFGVGLQRARRLAGVTQAVLAARLNRTATWVSAVERGDKRLDTAAMQALAEAVGSDLDTLLRWPERDREADALHAGRD